ncbi:MAG: TetR/AcrR family transcriptional regulator [Leptospiraceae bacterium]
MVRPRSGDKDQALVDAAIHLFLNKGVKGTTIQDIATQAGVGVGTVYTYFKDKKSIVRKVAFAFADRHREFSREILDSKKKPLSKLNAYLLGFFDIWQPFGENQKGPMELAEAVFRWAPETPEIAQKQFLTTIEEILKQARASNSVIRPQEDAKWIAICTSSFFPLAGTPQKGPLGNVYTREDLKGLIQWLANRLIIQNQEKDSTLP